MQYCPPIWRDIATPRLGGDGNLAIENLLEIPLVQARVPVGHAVDRDWQNTPALSIGELNEL